MCVTLSTADDFEELTELWEASVRATHHFIPEQYILKLKPLVWSVYLRSMPVYTVRGPERIEGFMGINGDMLEMLFVHPQAMGKGVGKKLLKYAINSCRVRYVDVNEQNEQAYGFYRHLGFKVIGRDATDASGEPYPILHLKLKENMKIENWGTVPYSEAWERQTVLFNALVEAKQEGKPYENRIILWNIHMSIRWGRAEKMRICCWVRHNCKPLVQRFIISTGGEILPIMVPDNWFVTLF